MKRFPLTLNSQVAHALLPDFALPLIMTGTHIRYRSHRVSAARTDRDKGALSIEMAMLVIALVAGAVLVVLAIGTLVKAKAKKIPATDTSGQ